MYLLCANKHADDDQWAVFRELPRLPQMHLSWPAVLEARARVVCNLGHVSESD